MNKKYTLLIPLLLLSASLTFSQNTGSGISASELIKELGKHKLYRIIGTEGGFAGRNFNQYRYVPVHPGDPQTDTGHYLVKAYLIKSETDIEESYITCIPREGHPRFILAVDNNRLEPEYLRDRSTEIIAQAALDYCHNTSLYYSKALPELGIEILENGIKTSANNVELIRLLGEIYGYEQRYAEAIETFLLLLETGQNNRYACLMLTHLYKETGNTEKADYYWKLCEEIDDQIKKEAAAREIILKKKDSYDGSTLYTIEGFPGFLMLMMEKTDKSLNEIRQEMKAEAPEWEFIDRQDIPYSRYTSKTTETLYQGQSFFFKAYFNGNYYHMKLTVQVEPSLLERIDIDAVINKILDVIAKGKLPE